MKYFSFAFKALILVLILWFLFNDINLDLFLNSIKNISLVMLFIIILTIFLQVAVLTSRWQFVSKNYCKWIDSYNACMITALFNTILPARLGELSRVFYLKLRSGLQIKKSLVYLIIERFFDILILIGMLLIVTYLEANAKLWQTTALIVFIVLLTFVYIIKSKNRLFYKLFYKLPNKKIKKTLYKLHFLLHSRLSNKSILIIIAYTITIYLVNLGSLWIFLNLEMGYNFTFTQLFIIFTIISIGFIIPLNPGGFGTYHAAMVLVLSFYNIPKEEALMIAIIMHLIQVGPSSIWGSIVLLIQKISPN